jgi:hypothetical protein
MSAAMSAAAAAAARRMLGPFAGAKLWDWERKIGGEPTPAMPS